MQICTVNIDTCIRRYADYNNYTRGSETFVPTGLEETLYSFVAVDHVISAVHVTL